MATTWPSQPALWQVLDRRAPHGAAGRRAYLLRVQFANSIHMAPRSWELIAQAAAFFLSADRPFRDGHHIIRSQGPAYHSPSDGWSYRKVRLSIFGRDGGVR
jgi:hypothetical protein